MNLEFKQTGDEIPTATSYRKKNANAVRNSSSQPRTFSVVSNSSRVGEEPSTDAVSQFLGRRRKGIAIQISMFRSQTEAFQ